MPDSARAILDFLAVDLLEFCKIYCNQIIGSQQTLFNVTELWKQKNEFIDFILFQSGIISQKRFHSK